ncbi:MAG TPA: DUF4266 domain-containing protein [Haliangiales bacterium]|nr:DUF4266 domain-containing protein [Haliangiales bacterium]
MIKRIVVVVALLLGGCAVVKPWQREDLARRAMVSDVEAGEARFQGHARGAREGADGGSGEAGGGCGCN